MAIKHHKIKHKSKEKLVQKIYWPWSMSLHLLIISIGILGIFLGLGMIIHQWSLAKNQIREHQALQVFVKIDDIAHEQYLEMLRLWNPHHFTWSEEFIKLDTDYHNAPTISEKYEAAKKMVFFMDNVDSWLQKIWWLDTTGDQNRETRYHEVRSLFNTLYQ